MDLALAGSFLGLLGFFGFLMICPPSAVAGTR